MVVVGVDAHKRTHTCVAVDRGGRKLGEKTVPATTVGNASALRWALLNFGSELTWGIEDVRNVSRRLEQELVRAGQRVVRVPTHLMARTRASARTRGKSDSIDATAVARAVLREPDLPVAHTIRYRASWSCSLSDEKRSSNSAPRRSTARNGVSTNSTRSARTSSNR
jgi:transposase